MFSRKNVEFAREAIVELVGDPDIFKYKASNSKSLIKVLQSIDSQIEYMGEVTAIDEDKEFGAQEKLQFKDRSCKNFYVYRNGKKIWADISCLDEGSWGRAEF